MKRRTVLTAAAAAALVSPTLFARDNLSARAPLFGGLMGSILGRQSEIVDFTRFCRQTSTSKLKLFKRKRAQLVKMTVPSHSIIETLNVVKYF